MRRSLLMTLMFARLASAQTVEVLRSNGPSANRIDIAIVGDGYTATEQTKLTTDATAMIDGLLNFAPYQQFSQLFNVKLIHGVSNQDGADNGTAGGLRDTRYGAYFNCGGIDRLLCVNTGAVLTDVQALVPEADLKIVVVNDPKYGGSGGGIVVASTNSSSLDILRHELGQACVVDAGVPDAGPPDAGPPDAGAPDAGAPDAETPDAGALDAGAEDAGAADAGTSDAGTSGEDAGPVVPHDAGASQRDAGGGLEPALGGCGCGQAGGGELSALLMAVAALRRRTRRRLME